MRQAYQGNRILTFTHTGKATVYLNQVQHDNVSRTLKGIEQQTSELNRKLHDINVNKIRVQLAQIQGLVDYALTQIK